MPLEIRYITPTILEVHEQIMSFTSTKHSWWYIDTERWLRSCNGYKDEPPISHMNSADIAWCQQYYIPKAKEYQA